MEVESAALRPVEIYARVFREMRPRTPLPEIRVEFKRYANANAQVKWEDGMLRSGWPTRWRARRKTCWRLWRRSCFRSCSADRCRPRAMTAIAATSTAATCAAAWIWCARSAGASRWSIRKAGIYDLDQMFEELNFRYFFGLMACPRLGWSPNASRTLLGHYDPSHNAIVLSRILDRPETPRLAVEYVLFHEMLHLRHPAEHRGARRCVHTRAFKEAEKQFEHLKEAKAALRRLG